jgi:hypothetical protein
VTGSAQDTFLRFVDSLAAHLDDHRAGGAELAARHSGQPIRAPRLASASVRAR